MAIESDLGCGRNMDVYYKNLENSDVVLPIMVYSRLSSYQNAPKWIKNKVVYNVPFTTHYLENCYPDCKLDPDEHITHEKWTSEFIKFIYLIKKIYKNRAMWLLDHPLPILEKAMGPHLIQIFHGELFKIGPASYFNSENMASFYSYDRIFISGKLLFDEVIRHTKINPKDSRIRMTGRVLNDSLYTKELNKKHILKQFKLNPLQKTVVYAPSWESLKIWPIGKRNKDVLNLEKFCEFIKSNNLNLIIRPHPICIYQYDIKPKIIRTIKKFPNMYFDDSSSSSYYGPNKTIIAGDVLVTDLSTISVDFMSLGKPAIYLYPDNSTGLWGKFFPTIEQVAAVSYVAKNFSELNSLIKKLTLTNESLEIKLKRKETVSYVFHNNNGTAGNIFLQELESYTLELMHRENSLINKLWRYLFKRNGKYKNDIINFSARINI